MLNSGSMQRFSDSLELSVNPLIQQKMGLSGIPNTNFINNFIYMKNSSRKSIRVRMGQY
jgi:hypothetical protein